MKKRVKCVWCEENDTIKLQKIIDDKDVDENLKVLLLLMISGFYKTYKRIPLYRCNDCFCIF